MRPLCTSATGRAKTVPWNKTSKKIAAHGEIYGMAESCSTDGNDLLEVKSAVKAAVDRARGGGGPSLIVNDTYRWRGHSKSDRNVYRTKKEIEEW